MTAPATVNTKPAEPSTQLTRATFKTDIEQWAPEIGKVAYKGFTPDRVLAAALQAAVHEPKLFEATPQSLYLAIMKSARWGLDIGDTVHLVPLNKKISKREEPDRYAVIVEAWPDYKGLKALAIRQGIVRGMEEYVVYAGDRFEFELGMDAYLRHQPVGDPTARGAIVGAYTIIRLPFSQKTFNYMPIADIEAIRAKSKSWAPGKGYPTCPPWYAKKTVVRDYLNRQPKQGALQEALAEDDTSEDQPFDRETGEVFQRPRIEPRAQSAPEAQQPQPISEQERRRLYVLFEGKSIDGLTEAGPHEALHVLLRQIRRLPADVVVSSRSIVAAEVKELERLIAALPELQSSQQ